MSTPPASPSTPASPPPAPADPEPVHEHEDPEKGRVPAPDPVKPDHPAG